jgi:pyruvate/2-oxoglutarate dehydrogenase complex dihydrolipoamide dehydrogenase (E3) component
MTGGHTLRPDLCIIGAGAAGLSVAATAAALGVPAVLIERGAMGGDCLNSGCVPSKALLAAAGHVAASRAAGGFGVMLPPASVDFDRVKAHVRATIAAIAPNDSVARYRAMGVTVIEGSARFVGPRRLEAVGLTIEARRFVVATGALAAVPPIDGLENVPFHTNETIFELDRLPPHLLIIGGGPIGCELAQAFRRLGSAVTIVEGQRALAREDSEVADQLISHLRAEGIRIEEGVAIRNVSQASGEILVRGEQNGTVAAFAGTHLLVATGRRPTVEGLGLEAAGVAFDPRRGITVDAGLRPSNRRIYAIGDCATGGTGGLQFTHAANHHAGLVIRSAVFRLPARMDVAAIPRVTYTDPELATVGLTEAEARAAGHALRILRFPFAENDRAVATRATAGLVKAVVDRRGRILGATILGREAGEQIALWSLARNEKLTVASLRDLVFAYPTLSETSRRAALGFYAESLRNPWLGRVVRFLRRFG